MAQPRSSAALDTSPQPADRWDRSHDALVNSFTMSIEQVANRVFYYGSNDSFVLAFWNQRVDTPQVITEMAAQALMLNVDRCTKNHVYAHLKGARFVCTLCMLVPG